MQEHTAVPMFNFDRPRSARPATPPATPRLSRHWRLSLHRDLFAADAQARDSEQVTLEAADGFRIAAEHQPAAAHTRAHVVVAGAVGVPQRFYRRFAAFAAAAGYATLTFDFRGLGRSAPRSLDGFRMDYFDWGRQDLAAAIAAMSRPDVPLYVVGHSYGGHSFGLVPQPERVAAMFTFGTGAGWHGWMPPLERIRVLAMWHILGPLLTRWNGYLAWSLLGMGEDIPLDFYRSWKRWCRYPRYYFDDPSMAHIARRYERVRAPLMAANSTDDRWSPPASRDAFIAGYRNAARETADIEPARFGMKSIGHLGYFRPDAVRLWEYALAWLDACSARTNAEQRAVTTHAPWRSRPLNRAEGLTHDTDRSHS